MRQIVAILLYGSVFSFTLNAQSIYIKGFGVYGFSSHNLNSSYSQLINGFVTETEYTIVQNTPIGIGFFGGAGIGYFFNEHIGIDLAFAVSSGKYQEHDLFDFPNNTSLDYTKDVFASTTGLYLQPAIIFSSNNTKRLFIYGRLNPVLTLIVVKSNVTEADTARATYSKLNGNKANFAASVSIGGEYSVSKSIHIFLDVASDIIYSPDTGADYIYKGIFGSNAISIGLKFYFKKKKRFRQGDDSD